MKRFLILSDSHGRTELIKRVLELHKDDFDFLVHLGDFSQDVMEYLYMGERIYVVKGNMDPSYPDTASFAKSEIIVSKEGFTILIVHGHQYEVHFSVAKLEKKAMNEGIDIVIYGHTHKAEDTYRGNIYFFNPGALKHHTYGFLTLDDGKIIDKRILKLV